MATQGGRIQIIRDMILRISQLNKDMFLGHRTSPSNLSKTPFEFGTNNGPLILLFFTPGSIIPTPIRSTSPLRWKKMAKDLQE